MAGSNRHSIVADSSALISLLNGADHLHTRAMECNDLLIRDGWSVLVPSEVFAETLDAVGKKLGRRAAILVGTALLTMYQAREFDFIQTDPTLYESVLALENHASGGPSFVDCLVMSLADSYDTRYVFGFDATFRKNGYLLPEAMPPAVTAA